MTEWISWLATGATVTAALVTASNLGARITGYGFVIFLFGSVAWLIVGATTGQAALLWTNAILTLLNMFGIWRWLGRQRRMEEGAEAAQAASRETPGEGLFPASLLTRAEVVDDDGAAVGHGIDAMVGSRSGLIHYLVVSAGGLVGVGEQLRRLDWREAAFDRDRLRLPMSRSEFESLPTLPRDDWPAQ